jgi:hypothetical protein
MTMPETVDFVNEWDTQQLYRIKLEGKLAAGKDCNFELKISK